VVASQLALERKRREAELKGRNDDDGSNADGKPSSSSSSYPESQERKAEKKHEERSVFFGLARIFDPMDFKLISGEKGSGFFGKIVVAERKATGNMVAIKEQKKNECMSNEELDEVQILSLLGKHRNVVEFLGTVTFEGKVGLVTRFYPRFSLDRMHQKMNLCANDAVRRIAGDILRGLAFIHDRNIVHRDLACRNFFMDNDGTVVIGDFGLACSLDRKRPFDLLAKPVPKYSRAPESIRSCNMSLKSDIWMLGVAFCVVVLHTTHNHTRTNLFCRI